MAANRREPREGHVAEANRSAAEFRRGSKQGHVVAGILPHLKRSLLELAHINASYLCAGLIIAQVSEIFSENIPGTHQGWFDECCSLSDSPR